MKQCCVENPITVMKRHEMKYLLNAEQTACLRACLKGHMEEDAFGKTSIQSLYYDTPDYRLIRYSLEKPAPLLRTGHTDLSGLSGAQAQGGPCGL